MLNKVLVTSCHCLQSEASQLKAQVKTKEKRPKPRKNGLARGNDFWIDFHLTTLKGPYGT
jgi:hypothetical protein